MRRWTMEGIRARVNARRKQTEESLQNMRQKWEQDEGSHLRRRNRPRDPDEVRVLDKLAKKRWQQAEQTSEVHYDPERRVLRIEKLVEGAGRAGSTTKPASIRKNDGDSGHPD